MKIRLGVIDDEGMEKTSVEFSGRNWKEYLIKFIDSIDDTQPSSTESSFDIPAKQPNSQTTQTVQQPVQQPVPQPVPQNLQYYSPLQQPMYYYYVQPPQYQQPPISPLPQTHLQSLRPAAFPPTPSSQSQQYTARPVVNGSKNRSSLHDRLSDATLTINERLELFLKYEYPRVWFTSQDVQKHYERVYGNIKLSTVSTYLSRMYSRSLLERRGNRTQREYKYIADEINENESTEYVSINETVRI